MFIPTIMNGNITDLFAKLLSAQGLEYQYVEEKYKVFYLKENLSIAFARSVKIK